MRKITWFTFVVVMASCSSPKMVYYFDHYDYKSVNKDQVTKPALTEEVQVDLELSEPGELVASTDLKVLPAPTVASDVQKPTLADREEAIRAIKNMSKEERKEFRKELKHEIKSLKKNPAPASTKALGHDLRWAAIFGAIGVGLLIIGGDVLSVLGGVALLIGLIFLIKWIATQ